MKVLCFQEVVSPHIWGSSAIRSLGRRLHPRHQGVCPGSWLHKGGQERIGCKYSVNPLLPSEKAELSRKSCYTVAYGTHRTTREVDLRTCTSEREWHHALFPTDGGTDKAGLYPAQMGGALLAEATRATSGARNRPEGGGGSTSSHNPRPTTAPVRHQERAI